MIFRRLDRVALACSVAVGALASPALAQNLESATAVDTAQSETGTILVTGSRIKQDPTKSALPLEVITPEVLSRNGISSPEQLNMYLTSNGSGADNLASNADVVSGAQRGTNGLSSANLRGQGSAATLILLNSRRVAAHGLSGSAVDVNQIPFAAIERVEILKDGASAIYGTDAIGGVINYITRKDYTGVGMTGYSDVTEQGGGNIYSLSGIAGYGDLNTQGFNVMVAAQYRWNEILRGSERSFVNGNQPNRGLSIDTRGTPIATAFNIGANTFQTPNGTLLSGLTLTAPNGANAAAGGINYLDLPGGAGCGSMDGGLPYDEVLWNTPSAYYACAWDTGRAAVIQQPIRTLTYYGRGTAALGASEAYVEVAGSQAHSSKSFSNAQLSANGTNLPWAYPLNSLTSATYNQVFNAIRAAFPANTAALDARYGRPIAGRWRCEACGPREYVTDTDTLRFAGGLEGPLPLSGWDYRTGVSWARSQSSSVLGTGYFYRGTLANGSSDPLAPTAPGATAPGLLGLINSGILNPFSLTQSNAAIAGLQAVSAAGTTLYGGRYKTLQADASISGPLFDLPGGPVQIAVGVDYRRETYDFNGSAAAAATAPVIFLAAFDNVNALTPKSRTVKAAYAEVSVPILDILEVTGAVRIDDYTGFGTTTNPKATAKFTPTDWLMLRASYSTGFRVPSFNQIFNGVTLSPNPGSSLTDPTTCPAGSAVGSSPGCAAITPDSISGGNLNLGPETAEEYSAGIVLRPSPRWSFSADYWSIAVDNVIGTITIPQLFANIGAFPERIQRTGGIITLVDLRNGNFGSRRTKGIELSARGSFDALNGTIAVGADGTYMLRKKEKLLPNLAYTDQLGVFTLTGDLGLKWKHNAWVSYERGGFGISLTQIFRNSYKNAVLPNAITPIGASRPDYNARVKPYIIYNLSVSQSINEQFKITGGIKNLFDTDPPFAITYDSNTGAGSSWEPRVADPRGRSFTVTAEVKF